jgi:hypothetical protein
LRWIGLMWLCTVLCDTYGFHLGETGWQVMTSRLPGCARAG